MQPNRLGRLWESARGSQRASCATAPRGRSPRHSIPPPARPRRQRPQPSSRPRPAARFRDYAEGSRRVARGAGRFGSALVRPFAHATGVLALQITGVFFALFTVFFTVHAWQAFKAIGAHDRHVRGLCGLCAALCLVHRHLVLARADEAEAELRRAPAVVAYNGRFPCPAQPALQTALHRRRSGGL